MPKVFNGVKGAYMLGDHTSVMVAEQDAHADGRDFRQGLLLFSNDREIKTGACMLCALEANQLRAGCGTGLAADRLRSCLVNLLGP